MLSSEAYPSLRDDETPRAKESSALRVIDISMSGKVREHYAKEESELKDLRFSFDLSKASKRPQSAFNSERRSNIELPLKRLQSAYNPLRKSI